MRAYPKYVLENDENVERSLMLLGAMKNRLKSLHFNVININQSTMVCDGNTIYWYGQKLDRIMSNISFTK